MVGIKAWEGKAAREGEAPAELHFIAFINRTGSAGASPSRVASLPYTSASR